MRGVLHLLCLSLSSAGGEVLHGLFRQVWFGGRSRSPAPRLAGEGVVNSREGGDLPPPSVGESLQSAPPAFTKDSNGLSAPSGRCLWCQTSSGGGCGLGGSAAAAGGGHGPVERGRPSGGAALRGVRGARRGRPAAAEGRGRGAAGAGGRGGAASGGRRSRLRRRHGLQLFVLVGGAEVIQPVRRANPGRQRAAPASPAVASRRMTSVPET